MVGLRYNEIDLLLAMSDGCHRRRLDLRIRTE